MKIEEKITKLTWNDKTWERPSGTNGKSLSKKTHENSQGYGHEEWLLDKSRIISGYHYGFIQPLNVKTRKHVNKIYKLWLYTVTNHQKYLVGYIDNLECISFEESIEIFKIYKKNGWVNDMNNDLEFAGVFSNTFKSTPSDIFFNVKFKIKDVFLYDDYMPISKKDVNIKLPRYKLLDKKSEFIFDTEKYIRTDKTTRRAIGEVSVNLYHNVLQVKLIELLKKNKNYKNIQKEKNFIDVQALDINDTKIYFEIKTDTPKNNIRQAIGQLFEYSMYYNEYKANKLIIVGDSEPNDEVKFYIKHLRNKTTLPLYYMWIDMEMNKISIEY